MKVALIASILIGIFGLSVAAPQKGKLGRHKDYVPDATTAIAIAVAICKPIYGEKLMAEEMPYVARKSRGVWIVEGADMKQYDAGGAFIVKIQSYDAKILLVYHGK